jgi:hypothetical protein
MDYFQVFLTVFVVLGALGLLFSAWLGLNGYQEALAVGSISVIALMINIPISIVFWDALNQHRAFENKRDLVASIQSSTFNIVCDRIGVDKSSAAARPNCLEKDGFRVWRADGRLYLATVFGDQSEIDLIVDEDDVLSGNRSAIKLWSEKLDARRVSYAFPSSYRERVPYE